MGNIKKCKSVLIPQNKHGWIKGDICKCIHTSEVLGAPVEGTLTISQYNTHESNDCASPHWKGQHLYFISDDEIMEGDCFVHTHQNRIYKATKVREDAIETEDYLMNTYPHSNHHKKIVACTDPSLNLPMIPQSFIERYVAINGAISSVALKMEKPHIPNSLATEMYFDDSFYRFYLTLTHNNEVVILEDFNDTIPNSEAIDYEQEVKKVYPNAYHIRDCGGFPTHEIRIPPPPPLVKTISDMKYSKEDAWKSAYEKINQK